MSEPEIIQSSFLTITARSIQTFLEKSKQPRRGSYLGDKMQYEFRGKSIQEAVRKAVSKQTPKYIRTKGYDSAQAWAPPLFWGPWVEVFSQFGVAGADSDGYVTQVDIDFDTNSNAPSTFDIEIKGGDSFISSSGPGSESVTITGNVATSISVRCRSHSLGQNVMITASW